MEIVILAIIAMTLGGILAAIKFGFNEVISGLESINSQLENRSSS